MDLSTTYLGMKLRTPLVAGASPYSREIDTIRQLAEAGASAIVLHSLFEEQFTRDRAELEDRVAAHEDSFAEALSYLPKPEEFHLGPEEYLEHIRNAKRAVQVPIIASLNGQSLGGWTEFARKIQEAGADALELNIYSIPTDPRISSTRIEKSYVDIVKAVKAATSLPVAVKLSPFFTNTAAMARKLARSGAKGLVLFNRFYQPDIDLENLEVRTSVLLSTPQAMRLPLTWIGILHGRVKADLAATGGVLSAEDAIKMLMAGAKVTMLCSALLKHGITHIQVIEQGMLAWMEEHDYTSVRKMQGTMSQKKCPDPSAFERVQYIRGIHIEGPRRLKESPGGQA